MPPRIALYASTLVDAFCQKPMAIDRILGENKAVGNEQLRMTTDNKKRKRCLNIRLEGFRVEP